MMDEQILLNHGVQKRPVAPIGLIAPPGGKTMTAQINTHLVTQRRYMLEHMPRYAGYPGFSRATYEIDCACPRFATGEGKAILHESTRGYDLFLLADVGNYGSTCTIYGQKCPMSPDEHFQDIKRLLAAIGDLSRRVTVIMPYLYEGRQQHRKVRESLDCALALRELENLGVSNVVSFDAHDTRVQNAIPLTAFENLHTTYQIIREILHTEKNLIVDREHMVVVSPDSGAVERCLYYANSLDLDLSLFYKRRDTTRVVNGKNPIVAHELLGGSDIAGKDILIVDDIMASGESMLQVAPMKLTQFPLDGSGNFFAAEALTSSKIAVAGEFC